MRKLLSMVLVLSLVLGSMSFAFAAPADVEGTDYESAVERLMALGVITGFEDGTFKPNETITRAQFAAIVVRALGLDAAAKVSGGTSQFTDVDGHWAAGYINLAAGQKIVNGYPDGTFNPNAPVKFEEAVTMIVRTLGYEPAVVGGYPAGYLAKAAELEITDDVKGTVGVFASRGVVAQLVDNSLEIELMERQTWGDEANYEPVEKTLLEDKIGVDVITGTVEAFDEDDKEVTIDGDDYDYVGVSFEGLINSDVTAWKYDGDIVYVSVDSDLIYDFVADLLDANGDSTTVVEDVRKIELENGKTYKVKLDEDGKNSLPSSLAAGDFAKVVLNDSKVANVENYVVSEAGLINSVEEDIIEYTKGDSTKKIRDLDDADEILVIINGEKAEYSDLEEGMYFDYAEYDADEFIFVATDETVTGELERIKWEDDEIRIDGEYYDLAGTVYYSVDNGEGYATAAEADFDNMFEEDITAVLNNLGEIVYVSADVEEDTSTFYGFLTAVDNFADKVKVEMIVDGDIETVTYEFDADEVTPAVVEVVDEATKLQNFYEFEVDEDNVIIGMDDTVLGSSVTIEAFDDDNDTMTDDTNKYYYVDSDVMIFDITDYTDVTTHEWADIEATDVDSTDTVTVNVDGTEVTLMVITAAVADLGSTDEYEFGFVLDRERISSDEYEYEIMTLDGKITVAVDDSDKVDAYNMVAYELTSDDEADIVANSVYDNMAAVAAEDSDWTADTGNVDANSVDGDVLDIDGVTYKVASDAIIYEVVDASDDDYAQADLSDINDEDSATNVSFIVENGLIKVLFFWR